MEEQRIEKLITNLKSTGRPKLEEQRTVAHIEGRPDLFETKVLHRKVSDPEFRVLVGSRDPGSAAALAPVLDELENADLFLLTDGRAEEAFRKNLNLDDVTPEDGPLATAEIVGQPDILLMDISSGEMGIDTYLDATFDDIPKVLVEDYYTTAIKFLRKLKERDLPFPEKICVMDQGAKEIVVEEFPDLESRIVVTGQPAFDKFAKEDTQAIGLGVKEKLGLRPEDKLVSFMSTMDEPEKIEHMAKSLQPFADQFCFVFRRHPRDNTSYETFKNILTSKGIRVLDTDTFTTDQISAASDVVITTWSTEGLSAIYRGKPTIHLVDSRFRITEGIRTPLVPVKLGASVGIENADEVGEALAKFLQGDTVIMEELRANMERYYSADGNNAKRVADVVRELVEATKIK